MKFLYTTALLVFNIVLCPSVAIASHLRGGEINIEALPESILAFKINIILYGDQQSPVLGSNGQVDFGDGSGPIDIIDIIDSSVSEKLSNKTIRHTYSIKYTYSSAGTYVINYREYSRRNLINVTNSINTPLYLESKVVIDPFIGQNNSPVSFAPQLAARIGSPFIDNPMTNDVEGDSISFRLITPLQDIDVEVNGYQLPNMISDPNGAAANEDGTGKPEFFFEIRTGEIIWDAPVMAGAYVITYLIEEWRVIDGSLFQLGYTIREFHVEVEEIQNNRPYLVIPADTLIQAGDTLIVIIQGFDPDGDDFNIESSGAIYNLDTIPAEYSLEGNELKFSWKTDPDHISPQAYEVVFRIYDNPGEGPILYDYKTWRIMVSNVTAHNDSRRLGQLKIYPNPSAGIFNIENNFEEQGAYNFLVYDQRLRLYPVPQFRLLSKLPRLI